MFLYLTTLRAPAALPTKQPRRTRAKPTSCPLVALHKLLPGTKYLVLNTRYEQMLSTANIYFTMVPQIGRLS